MIEASRDILRLSLLSAGTAAIHCIHYSKFVHKTMGGMFFMVR